MAKTPKRERDENIDEPTAADLKAVEADEELATDDIDDEEDLEDEEDDRDPFE